MAAQRRFARRRHKSRRSVLLKTAGSDESFWKVIEAEPFDAFAVHPTSISVYHLGNNGTARKLLKTWPLTT